MIRSSKPFVRNWCCLGALAAVCLCLGCGSSGMYRNHGPDEMKKNECVILLHGLGRTHLSMRKMARRLKNAGYMTVNFGYPSTRKRIERIAQEHASKAVEQCRRFHADRIHFVTHSMGGIVTRQLLKTNRPANLGRVVMLSPPNQGSRVAEALKDRWFYIMANGPAGRQLSTSPDALPRRLGPVDYPVGVITGNRAAFFDIWLKPYLDGENDGKVSAAEAKVDGMSDFLVVPETHTTIMDAEYVQDQTLHFLKHGAFR